MSIKSLLNQKNSTLTTMSLSRIFLNEDDRSIDLPCDGYEFLIYPLIGNVIISNKDVGEFIMGGRKAVTQKPRSALRILNNSNQQHTVRIDLLNTRSADLLLVCLDVGQRSEEYDSIISYQPCERIVTHNVGKGTHRRQVRVI